MTAPRWCRFYTGAWHAYAPGTILSLCTFATHGRDEPGFALPAGRACLHCLRHVQRGTGHRRPDPPPRTTSRATYIPCGCRTRAEHAHRLVAAVRDQLARGYPPGILSDPLVCARTAPATDALAAALLAWEMAPLPAAAADVEDAIRDLYAAWREAVPQ